MFEWFNEQSLWEKVVFVMLLASVMGPLGTIARESRRTADKVQQLLEELRLDRIERRGPPRL